MFDYKAIQTSVKPRNRYNEQIERISIGGTRKTQNIQDTVSGTIENLKNGDRSFVIYGEPQSGKTEMMIALSARIIDEGYSIIIVLMNDSVDLLNQNLDRFKRSGIAPSPENFSEILDPVITIKGTKRIIFCKKNAQDLKKLIEKLGGHESKIVIDDEADFASPNSKINKNDKTKINELIGSLLGQDGIYIGVTATPARLDLNNTFENTTEKWVHFRPHEFYCGQDKFFPTNYVQKGFVLDYGLEILPDDKDDPKYLKRALISFIVNVAYLNTQINDREKNYSMLVHTSGKREDHSTDYKTIANMFNVLKTEDPDKTPKFYQEIYNKAQSKYPGLEFVITRYIKENIDKSTIIVINSDNDKKLVDPKTATNPATLFTIAIGGNIVSRGVTFHNLLSMFFTRDVKHKFQQDTYIQRARMFGSRGEYLKFFELHIPEQLYEAWWQCFLFHRLSLENIISGIGVPVWLGNKKISTVSKSSIDKANVSFDHGHMSFDIFDYDDSIDTAFAKGATHLERIKNLAEVIGNNCCPKHVVDFIEYTSRGDDSIDILKTSDINVFKDGDREAIKRTAGGPIRGYTAEEKIKRPNTVHFVKIFHNGRGKARLFYSCNANLKYLKNLKNDK